MDDDYDSRGMQVNTSMTPKLMTDSHWSSKPKMMTSF